MAVCIIGWQDGENDFVSCITGWSVSPYLDHPLIVPARQDTLGDHVQRVHRPRMGVRILPDDLVVSITEGRKQNTTTTTMKLEIAKNVSHVLCTR